MNDTSPEIARLVADRHAAMTPEERLRIAADMFESAKAIVISSLPAGLSNREKRLALARRFYEGELPEAALQAFADWQPAS
jgi:hypothetical protein